jgi:hypothetical protein
VSRRRYRYDEEAKALVEVSLDYRPEPRTELMMGECYQGRALDGTDISSRRKFNEHLRATGLAPAADFTETWAKAEKERVSKVDGSPNRARREAVERSIYQLEQRSRR